MLSQREKDVIHWYRFELSTLERIAVNCYLVRGDDRLILALRDRSNGLKRFDYHTLPKCLYQPALHRAQSFFS